MGANFNPSFGPMIPLKPFRFWCQKVLPLVYDDSLSYYELLCKVVDYLNKTMEDVDTLEGDIQEMYRVFTELQNYVNQFFEENAVEVAENALDDLAERGELDRIIGPYVNQYAPEIIREMFPEIAPPVINQVIAPIAPDVIAQWLSEHPEATTTVEDGAITYQKFAADQYPFVTLEMFGAVGNDPNVDNRDAFNNCFNYAVANGKIIIILDKTYYMFPCHIAGTNLPEDTRLFIPSDKNVTIWGLGEKSELKNLNNSVSADSTRSLLWFVIDDVSGATEFNFNGPNVYLNNLCVNGNYTGQNLDSFNTTKFEHCGTVRFTPAEYTSFNNVVVNNVFSKDPIADGFNTESTKEWVIKKFYFNNFNGSRTRANFRKDIDIIGTVETLIVENSDITGFREEPGPNFVNTKSLTLKFFNTNIRGQIVCSSGGGEGSTGCTYVLMRDCLVTSTVEVSGWRAKFFNCTFKADFNPHYCPEMCFYDCNLYNYRATGSISERFPRDIISFINCNVNHGGEVIDDWIFDINNVSAWDGKYYFENLTVENGNTNISGRGTGNIINCNFDYIRLYRLNFTMNNSKVKTTAQIEECQTLEMNDSEFDVLKIISQNSTYRNLIIRLNNIKVLNEVSELTTPLNIDRATNDTDYNDYNYINNITVHGNTTLKSMHYVEVTNSTFNGKVTTTFNSFDTHWWYFKNCEFDVSTQIDTVPDEAINLDRQEEGSICSFENCKILGGKSSITMVSVWGLDFKGNIYAKPMYRFLNTSTKSSDSIYNLHMTFDCNLYMLSDAYFSKIYKTSDTYLGHINFYGNFPFFYSANTESAGTNYFSNNTTTNLRIDAYPTNFDSDYIATTWRNITSTEKRVGYYKGLIIHMPVYNTIAEYQTKSNYRMAIESFLAAFSSGSQTSSVRRYCLIESGNTTAISLSQTDITINRGESATITATVTASDAPASKLIWTASDGAIELSSTGSNCTIAIPNNIDTGTYTVTVKPSDNLNLSATCTIAVNE